MASREPQTTPLNWNERYWGKEKAPLPAVVKPVHEATQRAGGRGGWEAELGFLVWSGILSKPQAQKYDRIKQTQSTVVQHWPFKRESGGDTFPIKSVTHA